jgi:hypothetical protein
MTSRLPDHYKDLPHVRTGTRGNLFALSSDAPVPTRPELSSARNRLQSLGFQINEPRAGHFVLTQNGNTLIIHLYGTAELAGFAHGQAAVHSASGQSLSTLINRRKP